MNEILNISCNIYVTWCLLPFHGILYSLCFPKLYFFYFISEFQRKRIEYILEWNLLEISVKGPFCCTVSILQVYFTYLYYITFWALEHDLIENLRLILKQIMEKASFIISHRHYVFHFTTMILNYKSNDVFYSSNSL